MIELGRDLCSNLAVSSRREWLATNGIGGYASGTVSGVPTRRYHGLLFAGEPGVQLTCGIWAITVSGASARSPTSTRRPPFPTCCGGCTNTASRNFPKSPCPLPGLAFPQRRNW